MKRAIIIFRRDLRLYDNRTLDAAAKFDQVFPCFILDPEQVTQKNRFFSPRAYAFMIEALKKLEQQIYDHAGKLYILYGHPVQILNTLLETKKFQAVFVHRDYTPFSKERDQKLDKICVYHGVSFNHIADVLLHEPAEIFTHQHTPYTIFTPFYKRASALEVPKPITLNKINFYKPSSLPTVDLTQLEAPIISFEPESVFVHLQNFKDYAQTRDFPHLQTTHLSAHLKFGTLSCRQVYHKIKQLFGKHHALIRQLFWRDFYTHIAAHFPYVFGHPFRKNFEKLPWSYNQEQFERWCAGTTGFPLIDAGMRELYTTGFMHNRARMVVASFLIKDLHMDWQLGEHYFARMLIDYDPAINNGNWQWVASTGADAQPYFRIFNPWIQQKKYDKDCLYIKKWLPELRELSPQIIHGWYQEKINIKGYPKPLLDHTAQTQKSLLLYKKFMNKK